MAKRGKKFFLLSFCLTFSLGLIFLNLTLPKVLAADVNVNAVVPVTTGLCGDGIVDAGEVCDDGNTTNESCGDSIIQSGNYCNSTCSGNLTLSETCDPPNPDGGCSDSGQFCNDTCNCQNKGAPPCVPNCAGRQCGPNGCGGTCGICAPNYSCVGNQCVPIAECGNSIIEPGEDCDDGPDNSDTTPNTCRTNCQNPDCGDSVIDSGETCDDGNTASSDCCSGSCQVEVLIHNVLESVTNTTANISWETPCQVTTSLLEWGLTTAVSDGSISGLSGSAYSQTISDLEPNTTYYYRITATAGAITATFSDSFHTLGGVENCNNNIDDDTDGLCDYPASICTDGSTPGDPECVCSPDFLCTPGICNTETNKQIVACVDQTVPKCEADYEYEQDCEVCPGVFCGTCQELNEATCECVTLPSCCGNNVCEPPAEDPFTCLIDCPAECLSDWECTAWQPEICPASGIQTRDCFDKNACPIPINKPPTSQSCGPFCPGLTCGTCQTINTDICVCEELVPCCGNGICEASETFELCPADCIETCLPSWTCSSWGACVNGIQHRTCQDLNNCGLNLDRPPEVRSCTPGCDVACTICQQISLSTCSCQPQTPCCGNHSCEITETVWSCPVDCGLPPQFRLTLTQCLDGLDNDNDLMVDFPADPGCSKPADDNEMNLAEFLQKIQDVLQGFLDNPQVENINQLATPILIATIAINTFATFSFFNLLSYLQFFVTQPFAALFRRKRRKWGIVYNSLSKQPLDLAIVRLYKKEDNRLIQSRVTDKLGRFSFLVDPGRYYLTVTKPKYNFPTQYLKDAKEDIKYLDLYHGEIIEITEQRVTITLNIPVDPQEEVKPLAKVIFQYYLRKVQYAAAFSAIPLATISMVISPGVLTFTMFSFHCLLYVLFRRLGYQKPPKSWGLVYDKGTKKPLSRAITRIYDRKYNKLLETRVTDAGGRYSFLVNNNIYYVTAEKLGYKQFKTTDIDLVSKDREAIVGIDIGLEKGKSGEVMPSEPPKPSVENVPQPLLADKIGIPASPASLQGERLGGPVKLETPKVPEPPKPIAEVPAVPEEPAIEPALVKKIEDLSVGRESLEELVKAKQSVQEIQEEITEKKEELEKLEDKVEDIEESIDEKLDKLDQDNRQEINESNQPEADAPLAQKQENKETIPKEDIVESKPASPVADKPTDQGPKPPTEKSIFG